MNTDIYWYGLQYNLLKPSTQEHRTGLIGIPYGIQKLAKFHKRFHIILGEVRSPINENDLGKRCILISMLNLTE